MADPKLIRLITGEEILGEVTEVNDTYVIKNPVQLAVSLVRGADGNPTPQFGLMVWMVTQYTKLAKNNPNGIPVKKEHTMFEPLDMAYAEVVTNYNAMVAQLYGKLVVPAKTSLIIP